MHATTTLLPLLFATAITAMPFPRLQNARAVPDINMIIRNPTPVDDRSAIAAALDLDIDELLRKLGNRAPPALDQNIENPVDVVVG